MTKYLLRFSFLLLTTMPCVNGFAQISTTSTYLNNNGTGMVTFNLQNTNTTAVVVTGFDGLVGVSGSTPVEIYYKTSAISGNPGAISAANGWILAGSNTITGIANTTTTVVQPFITGLTLTIPASTTYGIVVYALNQRYYTLPGASTISAGGVNMISDATTAFGLGTPPAAPSFSPRGWIGNIYFAPATPCTGTPASPVITSAAITTAICSSATTVITATNSGTAGSQVYYQWQMATAPTGPWTNVTGGSGANTLSFTTDPQASTLYYRLKDSCGTSFATNLSGVFQVPVVPTQITSTTPGQRCATGTVVLAATGTGTGFNWYTAATGGTAIGTGSPFTTPVISATTTYYVASTSGTCEGARTAVTATVNTSQTAIATPTNSVVQCTGGATNLSANTGTGFTYQWQLNGTNISGATAATYAATVTGSYTVVVTNGSGCTGTSNAVAVTIGAPPSAAITPTGSVGYCPGGNTLLSAATTGTGINYQWSLNGTAISGATSSTYAAGTAGNYTVTVIVATTPTCNSTTATPTSVFTYVVPAAVINTPNGTAVCPGGTLALNVTASTGSTYQWSLNGTAISGAMNNTYSATAAGNYTVSVTYGATTGCTSVSPVLAVTTSVAPAATPALLAGATGCDSVGLTANTGTGFTYQWLLNGSAIPGATTPVYYAKNTGAYTLKVTNGSGCSTTSSSALSVVVNNSPVSNIYATGPSTFCAGGVVQLQVLAGAGLTYQWKQNGTAIAGATGNYYLATTAGAYTVQITSTTGCSYSAQPLNVVVNPLPVSTLNFNAANYKLTVNGTYVYTAYLWYYNNQPLSSATNSSYTASQPGSYRVAVTDSNGCTGLSSAYYVADTSHVAGIADIGAIRAAIKIYPNPATDKITIEAPIAVNAVLRDLSGRVLLEEKNVKTVSVGKFANGLYLLLITDTEGRTLRMQKVSKVD